MKRGLQLCLIFIATHYREIYGFFSVTPSLNIGIHSKCPNPLSPWCFMASRDNAVDNSVISVDEDNILRRLNQSFNLTFLTYEDLVFINEGDYVASSPFTVKTSVLHDDGEEEFRVLLYPRGGGHSSSSVASNILGKKQEGGFGMSYKTIPLFQQNKNSKVGVYLQYLPRSDDSSVDATFSLRLKGTQRSGPMFDVEWSAGMRFVSKSKANLSEGLANDFGAHLMQANLLPIFMGVQGDDGLDDTISYSPKSLVMQVQITTYPNTEVDQTQKKTLKQKDTELKSPLSFLPIEDVRRTKGNDSVHDTEKVRVGKVIVPVLRRLSERPRMFEIGAYPGVDFRIMRIFSPSGKEVFASEPGASYDLKPVYPLVPQLERDWPVRVDETEIPKLYTAGMYNLVSAIGSLFTAIGGLMTAYLISQMVSLFFIPSKSMDPTLQVGDVLVVEKVTPRLLKGKNKTPGDMVLFSPPSRLRNIVSSSGGKLSDRDLFVKRIAAGPGEVVSVDPTGSVLVNGKSVSGRRDICEAEPLRLIEKYIEPMDNDKVPDNNIFLMGDCSAVSVDSRVWGFLNSADVVGRPLFRIWPLERFGQISSLPETLITDWTETE